MIALALSVLRKVPAIVWVVLALLAWGGWQKHRADASGAKHAKAIATAAAERETALLADATETTRRLEAQRKVTNDANANAASRAADVVRLRAAEQRLRDRIAALEANGGTSNPAPADGSPSTGQTVGVLADMLRRCVGQYRGLAEFADAATAAGETCERSYDALTRKP